MIRESGGGGQKEERPGEWTPHRTPLWRVDNPKDTSLESGHPIGHLSGQETTPRILLNNTPNIPIEDSSNENPYTPIQTPVIGQTDPLDTNYGNRLIEVGH